MSRTVAFGRDVLNAPDVDIEVFRFKPLRQLKNMFLMKKKRNTSKLFLAGPSCLPFTVWGEYGNLLLLINTFEYWWRGRVVKSHGYISMQKFDDNMAMCCYWLTHLNIGERVSESGEFIKGAIIGWDRMNYRYWCWGSIAGNQRRAVLWCYWWSRWWLVMMSVLV